MPVEAVPFPDRATLLAAVRRILAQYEGTAVTVRQLYYRLVAAGKIPNNLRAYKNVVAALSKWRRDGEIPFDAFEDRTRGMNRLDRGERRDDPVNWARYFLKKGVDDAKNYQLARWFGQEYRVVVAVEKQALEGPFTEVCEELDVDLMVCRGYPSLSFLKEVADALDGSDRARNRRQNVLLYYGDMDPSGLGIPDTVKRDLGGGLFGKDFLFERIALTREQADEMDLIPAPVKLTDSRAERFVEEHGEEVFELDAIEPDRLQEMIRESVDEYFDDNEAERRDLLVAKGKKKIAKILRDGGVDRLVADLRTEGGDDDPDEPEEGE
jgi:hypothetical protein